MAKSRTVIKVGGELLDDEHRQELGAIAADVRDLIVAGHQIVFVHGGGPQTTAFQRSLGHEPKLVGGRRVTDRDALEAIKMVVGGKLNIDLCSALRGANISAVGLNGVSGAAILCVKRPPRVVSGGGEHPIDFGFVGDVTAVNGKLIMLLVESGYTPVLACIGGDEHGRPYNINADVVASGVAVALGADRLLLVTNTPGVLSDVHDPLSRIPRLSAGDAREAIQSGVVKGGMIPKVEESLEALGRGVHEVVILGKLQKGELRRAVESPGTVGTIVAD
jgi:acetylglutamate kinase